MILVWLTKEEALQILSVGREPISIGLHEKIDRAVRDYNTLPTGEGVAATMVVYRKGELETAVTYDSEAHADRAWAAIRRSIVQATVDKPAEPPAAPPQSVPAEE